MYVDEPTGRSTGRWLTQTFLEKSVLDMCMFHVSQSSLSIVTIASVLLSSQVFRQFGTRSGLQGGGGEGGEEGRLQGTPFSLKF